MMNKRRMVMPRRYPNPILSDEDTELYDKLVNQPDSDALVNEIGKFVKQLEKSYPINDFSITDYAPMDRFGGNETPRFYGSEGYHSAQLYVFICYQLALSADEKVRNEFKRKFYDFCWREIDRLEEEADLDDWKYAIKGSIFYYLFYLIAVSGTLKDIPTLIRTYTKYSGLVSESDKLKLWPQSQHKKAAPYYEAFESIVNSALALTEYPDLVTASHPKVIKAFTQAIGYALDDEPCLIIGETGTGKELIARAIHAFSLRKDNNFRAVSCAGFTPTMFNAEIQGICKGYAADITHTRLGVFLDACSRGRGGSRYGYDVDTSNKKDEPIRFRPLPKRAELNTLGEKNELVDVGGTVFLDEISSLDLPMQSALLRIIQESEVLVLGENQPRKFHVKLICAGNANFTNAIAKGEFREDLYYRIDKGSINVPALRELKSSFEEIVTSRINKIREKIGLEKKVEISRDAMRKLKAYDWPGNMRQLENVLYRSLKQMQINNNTILKSNHIEELIREPVIEIKRDYKGVKYDQLIKEYLKYLYDITNGNQSKAAEHAGIERLKIRNELIQYGIYEPKKRSKKR